MCGHRKAEVLSENKKTFQGCHDWGEEQLTGRRAKGNDQNMSQNPRDNVSGSGQSAASNVAKNGGKSSDSENKDLVTIKT